MTLQDLERIVSDALFRYLGLDTDLPDTRVKDFMTFDGANIPGHGLLLVIEGREYRLAITDEGDA